MSVRTTQYNIKVDLHEVKDLLFRESPGSKEIIPNPYFDVIVNGVTKSTAKRNQISTVQLNESFNFAAALTSEEFARAGVEIVGFHKYIIQSGYIASYGFSFRHIYSRAQHWVYRQWVKLCNSDMPGEDLGLLLVTVGVFGPGDAVPAIDETPSGAVADGETSHVAAKLDLKPTYFNLNVMVYKGQDIPPCSGGKTAEPFVKVKWGAASQKTKCQKTAYPEWNCAVHLPAYQPCHDGNVVIELWNGEANSSLINVVVLDFFELIKEVVTPRWFNFYWNPPKEGVLGAVQDMILTTSDSKVPSCYGGRLLIGASATKAQVPQSRGLANCRVVAEPTNVEHNLWVDLYEGSTNIPSVDKLFFEISLGPHTMKSAAVTANEFGSYLVDSEVGRLEQMQIYFPDTATSEKWDVFLYLCVDASSASAGWFSSASPTGPERKAWCRVSVTQIIALKGSPQWFSLAPIDGPPIETSAVLLSIILSPSRSMQQRPERLEYRLTRYYFRAFIYEGLHFPAVARDQFPDSYVKVSLGSHVIRTASITESLNPTFYEAHEVELMLPKNISLAPDLQIDICAERNAMLGSDIVLGSIQYPISKVPVEWRKAPEWMPVTSVKYPFCRSKVLMSFELIPAIKVEDDTFPFYDDIRPSTKEGEVLLFLVGIRMFAPITAPAVTVSFGRDVEESSRPLWSESVRFPIAGYGGNWNFLKHFNVSVALPKRVQHHAFLEVKVDDEQAAAGNSRRGMAYIPLNCLLPWLSESDKKGSYGAFRMKMLEDVIIEEAEKAARTGPTTVTGEVKEGPNDEPTTTEGSKPQHQHVPKTQAIPCNDPDSSNCLLLAPLDFICGINSFASSTSRIADKEDLRSTQEDANSQRKKSFHYQLTRSGDSQARMSREMDGFGLESDLLMFDLKVADEEKLEEQQRDEVPYELELDFTADELPYQREPIFRCTDAGVPEIVGYLKYVCSIFEEGDNRDSMLDLCKWLVEQYNKTRELIVRAYVLQAKGLVPSSGYANITTYVWIRNSDNTTVFPGGLSHNIRDTANARSQFFRPEFNRCYQLFCALPDHALLQVSIMESGTLSDECIGTSYIDMEDRFFSEKIGRMIEDDAIPIELRSLKHENSSISHGTLRGWYELMTEDFAQTHAAHTLTAFEPDDYQLRVVIWRVKAVPLDDLSQISLFVKATYQTDNGPEVCLQTDTHYNSKDGTAVFNWRFVYDIKIPTRSTIMKVQIWNYNLLSSGESIGENNFDLMNDFYKAKQRGTSYKAPKVWLNCSHPTRKGSLCGAVEMELSILPKKEAEVAPVGMGRADPNREPFLPNVTENRQYIDWNALGETVSAAGNAILQGLTWTGVWMTGALLVAAVVMIIIIIK